MSRQGFQVKTQAVAQLLKTNQTSAAKLALKTGYSVIHITEAFNGKRSLSRAAADILASELGVSPRAIVVFPRSSKQAAIKASTSKATLTTSAKALVKSTLQLLKNQGVPKQAIEAALRNY